MTGVVEEPGSHGSQATGVAAEARGKVKGRLNDSGKLNRRASGADRVCGVPG